MRKNNKKTAKPLWRKINRCSHRPPRTFMEKEHYDRSKKEDVLMKKKMSSNFNGYDLTPLFGYLRKNVGKKWDEVKSKALPRLPKEATSEELWEGVVYTLKELEDYKRNCQKSQYNIDRIMVKGKTFDESFLMHAGTFRSGDTSYFSSFYIDEEGLLQYVCPDLSPNDMEAYCPCCTWTFNGVVINKKTTMEKEQEKRMKEGL